MYSGDKLSLIVVADVLVNSNAYVLVLYRMLYKLILKLIYIYEIKKIQFFLIRPVLPMLIWDF